jgi:hypothetical protein
MSIEKRETLADIVAQIRAAAYIQNADTPKSVLRLADRIEAAWKRQEQCYLDQIRDAVNMIGHERFVAKHPPVGNAAAMREALEYAGNELRRAIEDSRYGDDVVYLVGCMRTVAAACRAALAAPARNCDVGTAEEQGNRMRRFCAKQKRNGIINCGYCQIKHQYERDCTLDWAQMPYEAEEGGAK